MIKKEFLYLGWYLLLSIPVIVLYIKFSVRAKKEWLALTGQIKPQLSPGQQQDREYIRLETAFPVEFQKLEPQGEKELEVRQGFTKNVSKTGMCIETLTLRGKEIGELIPNETRLKLVMNIPTEQQATVGYATVRWVRKTEDVAVDRYYIGVSFDDIPEPDLEKIIKYVLWFRRRPDIFAISLVLLLVLAVAFVSTLFILRNANFEWKEKLAIREKEISELTEGLRVLQNEREKLLQDLNTIEHKYAILQERLKNLESESDYLKKRISVSKKVPFKTSGDINIAPQDRVDKGEPETKELEEEFTIAKSESTEEPVVELRNSKNPEDEIVIQPNITRKMLEEEKEIYKTFRNYILEENTQLLDRYASLHKRSIYHAAGLFALAELRYKNRHIKEMVMKAYSDVISMYPNSKYASYASHRLEQIRNNLPYQAYSLRYFYERYNLPPLFDYRELEPYKE